MSSNKGYGYFLVMQSKSYKEKVELRKNIKLKLVLFQVLKNLLVEFYLYL